MAALESTIRLGLMVAALSLPLAGMAAAPAWWSDQNTVKEHGSTVTIFCAGSGPAKDLSYRAALAQCRSLAAEHARGAHFRVQSLTIETEQSASYNSEQSLDVEISGAVSRVDREFTEQDPSGAFHTYLSYYADLSHAQVKNISQENPPAPQVEADQPEQAGSVPGSSAHFSAKGIEASTDCRLVSISSIPNCDDILVHGGGMPRSLKCDSMPKTVYVCNGDTLKIRLGGYKQKEIKISSKRSSDTELKTEEVFLEKLQ